MLRDQLQGKDEVIRQLTNNLMTKGKEYSRLLEMHTSFKNKLMRDSCFHRSYAAKFVVKTAKANSLGLVGLSMGNNLHAEVTIGFIRDKSLDEEYFLEIETKEFNSITCQRDKRLVPVEDILEIEHTEGTQFVIRYMW